ncbi:hypothetical protein ASC80_05745 [Afipia sp. Root123D2]|uniref:hypothetical protein n=1 Tax=Afipia sp. Root123D2 TaxID=1736436 RepID=UPI0006FFED0D|nr:hypothetical protein [Afipia sp. Root123D2]KQW22843.1 hypothetical protein ASC80_05745 [Afipia sp. Root123D2]
MFNATPAIHYGHDKFAERNGESEFAPSPLTAARQTLAELAKRGHPLATHIVQIEAAMREKKRAEANGEDVPLWARERLSFLDEYREDEEMKDALAALLRHLQGLLI